MTPTLEVPEPGEPAPWEPADWVGCEAPLLTVGCPTGSGAGLLGRDGEASGLGLPERVEATAGAVTTSVAKPASNISAMCRASGVNRRRRSLLAVPASLAWPFPRERGRSTLGRSTARAGP